MWGEMGGTSYQWSRDQTVRRNQILFEDHLTCPEEIDCVSSLHVYSVCGGNGRYFIPVEQVCVLLPDVENSLS